MLPDTDRDHCMEHLLRGPVDGWLPALKHIERVHGHDVTRASPLGVGRNVVLQTEEWVVKLVPPFWLHMWRNECEALVRTWGKLTVAIPRLEASGVLDGWGYILMERAAGTSFGWRAQRASPTERLWLARLQGELVRELATIDLELSDGFRRDWHAVLDHDRVNLTARLASLPEHLVESAADYVDLAGDLESGDTFLHGDLSSINILIGPGDEPVLVDWSDATVGPSDHEFISPFFHQFRGDEEDLHAFWDGHGSVEAPQTLEHRMMARAILKYAALMAGWLDDLPGPMPATWAEAASRFTRLE